jgi:catechol 2,3-dioxygenase-like lactoylglutathione lyase family enzyme
VSVSSQDRALDFYVGKLGFEKCRDVPLRNGRWIEVAPRGASTTVALAPARDDVPAGIETGIRLATEDTDAAHAKLQVHGVDVDPAVTRLGFVVPPMFTFRDPDGNSFVIVGEG